MTRVLFQLQLRDKTTSDSIKEWLEALILCRTSQIKRMNEEHECIECMSKNTGQYMDPIEKNDGMHYYFLCEDCKYEWEIVRK